MDQLGYCNSEWHKEDELDSSQLPDGAPAPLESWSCVDGTTSVGVTVWKDNATVKQFFVAMVKYGESVGADFTQFSVLKLDDSAVVGAVDLGSETRATMTEVLTSVQEQVGGEIVSYIDLAS